MKLHKGIVSHDVVQRAMPKPDAPHDPKAETRYTKAATMLRVKLLEAAGGEASHHPVTQAELEAMQHVVRWRVGEDTPHGADAIRHLESLKAHAEPGTVEYSVWRHGQELWLRMQALIARKQKAESPTRVTPDSEQGDAAMEAL